MKTKRLCLFVVLIALLFGCKKNEVKNESGNNVFTTCFNTVNDVVGSDYQTAKQKLESDGWTFTDDCFEKEISGVFVILDFAQKEKIRSAAAVMTPSNMQTDLQDYSKFKKLIDKIGFAYKLSTGKVCSFTVCESSNVDEEDYQTFYNALNDCFNSEYLSIIWESDDENSQISLHKIENNRFAICISSYQ